MSLFTLDIPTAFLIVGFLYFLLPAFAWVVLRQQRTLQVNLWCGAGFFMGSSALLVSFREVLPFHLSILMSASLVVVSALMRVQSLCLDLGKAWRWNWSLVFIGLWVLIFEWLDVGLENYILRAQFMSLVSAGLFFYITSLAWQIGRMEHSPSASWIGAVYSLVGLSMAIRFFNLMNKTGNTDIVQETGNAQIAIFAFLLSSVVGHFGYVGLALDRSRRREIKAVEDRVRDEETLRLGKQIAQLDRQRSLGELSASLGHELNQPLAAIQTNAQVAKRGLLKGSFAPEQLDELLDKIIYNTQRASQIIERIRDFIRPSESRCEPVDLNQVVYEVSGLIADEAKRREVTFVFNLADQPVLVMGDPIQFSQILLNVFRNAIDALMSVEKRQVTVVCSRQADRAVITVRDNGPGFTADTLKQVGTPFFTTKANGLGMGLSISRNIAVQHGGMLLFSNADAEYGGGAQVILNLPFLSNSLNTLFPEPGAAVGASGLNKRERDAERFIGN